MGVSVKYRRLITVFIMAMVGCFILTKLEQVLCGPVHGSSWLWRFINPMQFTGVVGLLLLAFRRPGDIVSNYCKRFSPLHLGGARFGLVVLCCWPWTTASLHRMS